MAVRSKTLGRDKVLEEFREKHKLEREEWLREAGIAGFTPDQIRFIEKYFLKRKEQSVPHRRY